MKRKGKISRKTKETSISVDLNIDGKGKYKIDTGIGFLNHMLEQLSKHSSIDMNIKAKGDTHIDLHHTTEDTGMTGTKAVPGFAPQTRAGVSVKESIRAEVVTDMKYGTSFGNNVGLKR